MLIKTVFLIFLLAAARATSSNIICNFLTVKDLFQYNSIAASSSITPTYNTYQSPSIPRPPTPSNDTTKLQNVYHCQVSNGVTILTPNAKITSSTGIHSSGYTDNDVTSVSFKDKTIYYIPSGVPDVFKNLLALTVTESKLREICEDDLKGFTHLRFLNLASNDLTTLEANLFRHNLELETIVLNYNKIKQVEASAFDSVPNLVNLWIEHNSCVSRNATSVGNVAAVISEIKSKCVSCTNLEVSIAKCTNETSDLKAELKKKEAVIVELEKKLEEKN